jgi:hypothetical protein
MNRFIVCIGSWADTESKKKRLSDNTKEIVESGLDYGIATHLPDYDLCEFKDSKFFVYDSSNQFSSLDSPLFNLGFHRIKPQSYSNYYDCSGFRFTTWRGSGSHTFPIIRSILSCNHFSEILGYDYMIYCEEDLVWDKSASQQVKKIIEQVENRNADFYFIDSFTLVGTINPCFFIIKTSFLSSNLNIKKLKTLEDFNLIFPNKITEDILLDLLPFSKNYLCVPREKMFDIFGDYGVGWDTSRIGEGLKANISEHSIKSFTVNNLFLNKQEAEYNLGFLQAIHHLNTTLIFEAEISHLDQDGSSTTIFSASKEIYPYSFSVWPNFFKISPGNGSFLEIHTRTYNSEVNVEEKFRLSLERKELESYLSLYEFYKIN